jgi:hypothetical protein
MGILDPLHVIDSANINKKAPLPATEWIEAKQRVKQPAPQWRE